MNSLENIVTAHLKEADGIHPYDDRIVASKKALQTCINQIYTLSHETVNASQRQAIKRALNRLIEATVEVDALVRAFGVQG